MLSGVAIASGVVLGFAGGAGGHGNGAGRSAHNDGAPPFVSHTVIGAPRAALLRDAIKECDGPRFSHSDGDNPPTAFAGPLALAAGAGKFVGLIAISHGTTSVCAVRVPRIGPYGPSLQAHGGRLNRETPSADKLRTDALMWTGGLAGTETWAYGRAGRDVRGVTLILKNRRAVSAEVKNGWYMAWWPGRGAYAPQPYVQPTSVLVKTTRGTVVSPMPGEQCRKHASACAFDLAPR